MIFLSKTILLLPLGIMMRKLLVIFFLITSCLSLSAQEINLSGQVRDTLNDRGLENAVVMAVRVKDSVLTNFTRTNWKGEWELSLERDTFQVYITHPDFEEREFFIFGNAQTKDLDFGQIILPSKGEELRELVVFSNNEPIYFKGDTLVMVADSFKTAANANVEDLFKKLPGFDVDNSGKIMVHGEEVNKVYVDGDEFFGTDPTVATKNLPANAIENVQVYEEKVEGDNTEETEKVINLTLKEDAKKGYFGKVNGASDFNQFYEGEVLANKFNGSQKISVFGLFTNTPRSEFNMRDRFQYGLTEEYGLRDEDWNYVYEPQIGNLGEGLPRKAKAGFYYTDKWGKNLEVGTNFTYDNQYVLAKEESYTQFNLTDTTYYNSQVDSSVQEQNAYAFNVKLEWKIDSLTKLDIVPRVKQIENVTEEYSESNFFSEENTNNRTTENSYEEDVIFQEGSVLLNLDKDFKKKHRKLEATYQVKSQTNRSKDFLINTDLNVLDSTLYSSTDQTKNGKSSFTQHFGEISYTEPLHEKLKVEVSYTYQYAKGYNKKYAFDNNGEGYNLLNETYTSDFDNVTSNQKAGGRLIFGHKIHQIIGGAYYNHTDINSTDNFSDSSLRKTLGNVLPYFKWRIKFSQAKQLSFKFVSSVRNPTIGQLQPLPNNRNINNIKLGNINLISEVSNQANVNYFTYKATSGSHRYIGANYTWFKNPLSNALYFDNFGRAINQTVNVSGGESASVYAGGSFPFFKQLFKFDPNVNFIRTVSVSEINFEETTNENNSVYANFGLRFITDSLEIFAGTELGLNYAKAALSDTYQNYSTQTYKGGFTWKLRGKMEIASDVRYILNTQRADGFDLNYTLWNASISKMFLPKENLIISIEAKDLLNQNISNRRSIFNNMIVDSKTNIIGRYILLRAVYKFNVLKSQKNEDDLLQD